MMSIGFPPEGSHTTSAQALRASARASRWSCPHCLQKLHLSDPGKNNCPRCGHPMTIWNDRFVDFIGATRGEVDRILNWNDEFIARIYDWLPELYARKPLDSRCLRVLEDEGLVDTSGHLTVLGHRVAYHVMEYLWQTAQEGVTQRDEQFERIMDLAALGSDSRVVDIGCGAGQTLRTLAPRVPAERVGLDLDIEALAFGCRTADREGGGIAFACANGHALPLQEAYYTHVMSRVALNYMHQRRALEQMVRLVRPGGFLYLRVEVIWFDLWTISYSRSVKQTIRRLQDLCVGAIHETTGWQPMPGGRASGGRAFASVRRLTSALLLLGCQILIVENSARCRKIFGKPVQVSILAKRI